MYCICVVLDPFITIARVKRRCDMCAVHGVYKFFSRVRGGGGGYGWGGGGRSRPAPCRAVPCRAARGVGRRRPKGCATEAVVHRRLSGRPAHSDIYMVHVLEGGDCVVVYSNSGFIIPEGASGIQAPESLAAIGQYHVMQQPCHSVSSPTEVQCTRGVCAGCCAGCCTVSLWLNHFCSVQGKHHHHEKGLL